MASLHKAVFRASVELSGDLAFVTSWQPALFAHFGSNKAPQHRSYGPVVMSIPKSGSGTFLHDSFIHYLFIST